MLCSALCTWLLHVYYMYMYMYIGNICQDLDCGDYIYMYT